MASASPSKRSRPESSSGPGAKRVKGGSVNPSRIRTLNDKPVGDGPILYCEFVLQVVLLTAATAFP